jgi:hypothetical protein
MWYPNYIYVPIKYNYLVSQIVYHLTQYNYLLSYLPLCSDTVTCSSDNSSSTNPPGADTETPQ